MGGILGRNGRRQCRSSRAVDVTVGRCHRAGTCVRIGVNMAETVGIREARRRLAELVSRAEQGETVVITRGGREVARLGPPLWREQRRPGRMKGKMWAAPDWDETPVDLIEAMEGTDERPW